MRPVLFFFLLFCFSCSKLSHTKVTVLDDYDDCFSVNLQSLYAIMQTSPSEKFFKSGKSTKELVLRLGQSEYEDIHFVQDHTKYEIYRTGQNYSYNAGSRTWENITSSFLLYDIPTTISLPEVAAELSENNEIEIAEIRRFVKQNNIRETSSVLVTMLGTRLPGYMKIWFTNQRIQSFIDRPRQCTKCYSFMHPARVCEKTPVCHSCGAIHSGICQVPQKCVNCQGDNSATSKGCPLYIKEQNIMELKCRNHLTTAEARRIYNQSAKVNYASAVKANAPIKVPPFSFSEFWIFQETFFKHEDHFFCSSKTLFYLDRQDRPGGGLITGIPKTASARIIPTNFSHNANQEILAVEIFYKGLNFIIINLYSPQGFNIESAKQFFDSFSVPVFIFGDFNLHPPLWGSDKSSP
ncbi:hypothetical protein AVEN_7462-1 [Araneus ventricosus]|uniref:Endonuclease/exonuclease/phosphatase domain-containing protein n=1 Tax=Araneus ventricosus TaxID=182803 RepID=A0A4Y2V0B7_ARAVE|nr:hypothetical protein AVEN_7462-1 [Araneus ventricosus]